jgi:hypothetical protein
VPKTSKGSRRTRSQSRLTRKATQHQDFIGGSETDRAEAEHRKLERVAAEREKDVVREMASELTDLAAKPELRVPRSLEEGKQLVAEAREKVAEAREKLDERVEALPPLAKDTVGLARATLNFLLLPARLGLRFLHDVAHLPGALVHALRKQEA